MPTEPTERFTNSFTDYQHQILQELTAPVSGEWPSMVKLVYVVFDAFPADRYAIIYVAGAPGRLIRRTWNSAVDSERFASGVFNLDRIAITERTVVLTAEQADRLNKYLETPPVIEPFTGFILDGTTYSLTLSDQDTAVTYEWRHEPSVDAATRAMICFLESLIGA